MSQRVITFGCRLNACESDIISDFVRELGADDFVLINTCAVTREAERKLCQTIRKLHREDKNVRIILTGCASELNPQRYLRMNGVMEVISNERKLFRSEYLKYSAPGTEETKEKTPPRKIRGFLQIQNGCDQKCTYCVVRLARGPNVSFPKDEILLQAQRLLSKGYVEIVLTGVNISAYGRDLAGGENLASIIRHLLKNIPQLERLRLSSLDPADVDESLLELIKNEERLMPHFHQSVQSGDDLILKRMLRRHRRQQVLEASHKILEARPEAVLGADMIVGFPTETEPMFENTKRIIREARLSLLHVFSFSGRPGTAAAAMPQVERNVIRRRAKELKLLAREVLAEKLSQYVDQKVMAVGEGGENARTDSFLAVRAKEKLAAGQKYLLRGEEVANGVLLSVVVGKQ
ncbi:MAG: tRNA (N(6)-L-threonylcarbamoyladenosine(37)-C(2))-methylthiotransferase MtaB [Holosporaceae bacterium]|jgi:threonylcarbamoyladenosine tRNA methylthiotransferase MtaB|nr:tRNA (N(6)-L-threonylcarbamoyladenosine(37)-C(2))-methylthiotransferase MtaB [Holosporaceae bacterium]